MENKEDCSNCQSMREQVEELKRKHHLDFKTIKQKIISTDELIKLYQKKCQEFDKQTKCLAELTTKLEASQRNMDVVRLQLQNTLEMNEPLKKACNELEKEKELRKIEMQRLLDKLRGSENLVTQLKNVLKEKEKSEGSFKLDMLIQQQKIEERRKSLKKSESVVTKLKEQIMTEKNGKKEINKQFTTSQNQLKKKEKQVEEFQNTIANLTEKLKEAKKEITELKKRPTEKTYSPSPPKPRRITRKSFALEQQNDAVEKSSKIRIDEILAIFAVSPCPSLSRLPPSPCSAEKSGDITDDDHEFGNNDPDYIDDNDYTCDDGSAQFVNNVGKQCKNDVSESTASVCSEPLFVGNEGDGITNSARKSDRECSPEYKTNTVTLMSKRKRKRGRLSSESEMRTQMLEDNTEGVIKTKKLHVSENTTVEMSRYTKITKLESENRDLTKSETDNNETNSLNPSSSFGKNTILTTSKSLADCRSKVTEDVEREVSACLRSIVEAVELQECASKNLRTLRVDHGSSFVIKTNFETGLVNNSVEIIHEEITTSVNEDVLDCLRSVVDRVSNSVKHMKPSASSSIVQGVTRNEQTTVSESSVEVVDGAIVDSDEKTSDIVLKDFTNAAGGTAQSSSLTCNQWHKNGDCIGSSVLSDVGYEAKGSSSSIDTRNSLGKTNGKRSTGGILGNGLNKAEFKSYAKGISNGVSSNEKKPKDSELGSRFNPEGDIEKGLAGIGHGVVTSNKADDDLKEDGENISNGAPTNEEKTKDSESRFNTERKIDKRLAGIGGLVEMTSNKAEGGLKKDTVIIGSGAPSNEGKPKDTESDSRCNTEGGIDKEPSNIGDLIEMTSSKTDLKEHIKNIGPKTPSESYSCFNPCENFEGSPLSRSLTFSPDLPTPLSPIPNSPERSIQRTELPSFEALDDLPPLSPIPPSPKGLTSTVDPINEVADNETTPVELELKKLAEPVPASTVSKPPNTYPSASRIVIPAKQSSVDEAKIAEKIAEAARENITPVKKAPAIKNCLDRSPKDNEYNYVLRFLTKVRKGEMTTEVITKRFSIITNLRASSPFVSALIKILKHTSDDVEDELIEKYTEQCVGDETSCEKAWKPIITEFEMRVAVIVRELSKLKQFDGLICCLLSLLGKTIFGLFRSGNDSSAVLAICRMYTTVCRLTGDGVRVHVLCFDIVKENQRYLLTNKIIMSVGLVWPDVLKKNEGMASPLPGIFIRGPSHQSFLSTLQVITMSRETSSEFEPSTLVLQRLCGWSKISCGNEAMELLAFELVRLLRESSELATQNTTPDFGPSMGSEAFEAVKSLELLSVVLGWQWTNDVLVRDRLWPILEEWKRRELCRSDAVEGSREDLGASNKVELDSEMSSETVVGHPQMDITMEIEGDSQAATVCHRNESESGDLKDVEMDAKTTDNDNHCPRGLGEISDCVNEQNANAENDFHSEAKLRTSSEDVPGINGRSSNDLMNDDKDLVDCSPKTEERIGFQTTDVNMSVTTVAVRTDTAMPLGNDVEDEQESSIEKHNIEETIVSVLRLLGLLGLVGLQQEDIDLDVMVNLMCAVMSCIDEFQGVTFAIQLAAAYAILDMVKANPMKILTVLNKWTTRMEEETKGINLPAHFTEQLLYFRTYLSSTMPT